MRSGASAGFATGRDAPSPGLAGHLRRWRPSSIERSLRTSFHPVRRAGHAGSPGGRARACAMRSCLCATSPRASSAPFCCGWSPSSYPVQGRSSKNLMSLDFIPPPQPTPQDRHPWQRATHQIPLRDAKNRGGARGCATRGGGVLRGRRDVAGPGMPPSAGTLETWRRFRCGGCITGLRRGDVARVG